MKIFQFKFSAKLILLYLRNGSSDVIISVRRVASADANSGIQCLKRVRACIMDNTFLPSTYIIYVPMKEVIESAALAEDTFLVPPYLFSKELLVSKSSTSSDSSSSMSWHSSQASRYLDNS